MKFFTAILLIISSVGSAQGLCSIKPRAKTAALERQAKIWFAEGATMRSEVQKFGQDFQAAFAKPSFDAKAEEQFRQRYDEMNKRHKELYSKANQILFELHTLKHSEKNSECAQYLREEIENIRSFQSGLYNDFLEADPTVRAASHALSHPSS